MIRDRFLKPAGIFSNRKKLMIKWATSDVENSAKNRREDQILEWEMKRAGREVRQKLEQN